MNKAVRNIDQHEEPRRSKWSKGALHRCTLKKCKTAHVTEWLTTTALQLHAVPRLQPAAKLHNLHMCYRYLEEPKKCVAKFCSFYHKVDRDQIPI